MQDEELSDGREELRTQLVELNNRGRHYTSQIWQVPFAYVGIVGVVLGQLVDKGPGVVLLASLCGAVFGILVLIHVTAMANGVRRAVENICRVEGELGLKETAQYNTRWYLWPLMGVVILAVTVCMTIAVYSARGASVL